MHICLHSGGDHGHHGGHGGAEHVKIVKIVQEEGGFGGNNSIISLFQHQMQYLGMPSNNNLFSSEYYRWRSRTPPWTWRC